MLGLILEFISDLILGVILRPLPCKRAVAFSIDLGCLYLVVLGVDSSGVMNLSLEHFIFLGWVYFSLMEFIWGATLGKMALRLAVTGPEGNRVSFPRATARYLAKLFYLYLLYLLYRSVITNNQYFSIALAVVVLALTILSILPPGKPALYDRLTGTRVTLKGVPQPATGWEAPK